MSSNPTVTFLKFNTSSNIEGEQTEVSGTHCSFGDALAEPTALAVHQEDSEADPNPKADGILQILPEKDPFQQLLVSFRVARPVLLHLFVKIIFQRASAVFGVHICYLHGEKKQRTRVRSKASPIKGSQVEGDVTAHSLMPP